MSRRRNPQAETERPNQHSGPAPLAGCTVLPAFDGFDGHTTEPTLGEPADDERESARHDRTGSGRRNCRSTAGRFEQVNGFADFTLPGLDRAQIAVWLILWRDTKAGIARTSQADLARRAGTTTRTVERAVRRLIRAGLLTVVRRGGLGRGPSSYRVHPHTNQQGQQGAG